MSEKISDKIVRNTVFNTIGKFWGLIIAFALTPYIIGHIGTDMYGVWAIATSLTGYFGLLDFGIKDSYTKYISEFYAKKDYRSINQLINTGIVFYIAFMAAIIALAYVSMGFIISLFHVSAAMYDDAFFIFMIAIVTFALTNILNAFDAIQSGLQRMEITNKLSIIISIVMAAGTVFFIENGYGIRGLMVNNLIVLLISELACIVIAYKIFPYLRINPLMITKDMFKRLISFGYKLQLARAADTVTFQADRLLIAFFLNFSMVTLYDLGSRITMTVRSMPLMLVSAMLPAASEIHANQDHRTLNELYVRSSKYLMLVSIPLFFFTIISAEAIMLVWMGQGYETSAWVIQLLSVGYLVNLLNGASVMIGAAMGKPEIQMKSGIITVISNVVLCVVLVSLMGFPGIALAVSISLMLGPIYYFIKFHKEIDMPLLSFFKDLAVAPVLASLISSALTYALYYGLQAMGGFPSNRMNGFATLIVGGVIFAAAYLLIIWRGKYLDRYDNDIIFRYFKVGKVMSLLKVR